MDAKVAQELEMVNLTLGDLAQEELQELKEEIAFKEKRRVYIRWCSLVCSEKIVQREK